MRYVATRSPVRPFYAIIVDTTTDEPILSQHPAHYSGRMKSVEDVIKGVGFDREEKKEAIEANTLQMKRFMIFAKALNDAENDGVVV